jgi:hypothetical protein
MIRFGRAGKNPVTLEHRAFHLKLSEKVKEKP